MNKEKCMTYRFQILFCFALGFFMMLFYASTNLLWAQLQETPQQEVLETEVGMNQIIGTPTPQGALAQKQPQGPMSQSDLSFDEQKIMMINESLKNMIEENKDITAKKEELESQLKKIRGQSEINSSRVGALTRQRDDLDKRIKGLEGLQKEYEEEIANLKKILSEKEEEFHNKLSDIERKKEQDQKAQEEAMQKILPTLTDTRYIADAKNQQQQLQQKAQESISKIESAAQKTARKISELKRKNQKLSTQSAKVHYNMGNLFFEQGNYKRAQAEYKKVVECMPFDPAAHYNLAFVSGEFLNDQETALKHYQQYLFLEPNSEDADLVKEKILEAKLAIKTKIDSPIDASIPLR